MKKMSILFSMMVLAALLLSACAGGANNQETPGAPGTGLETPGVAEPGTTPDLGMEATPTLEVVDEMPTEMATPTVEAGAADLTATPEAGAGGAVDTTGTPQAEVPVTGDVCVPNRLTNILDMEVRDNTGNIVGEVEGVVVMRDASVAGAAPAAEGTADPNAVPTTDAGAVDLTATPAAGDGTVVQDGDDLLNDEPMVQPANLAEPHLTYVIVDVDDMNELLGASDVLVPFAAFQGLTPETPVEDCALVLTGDATTLETAPAFDDDTWDELYDEDNFAEWHGFWAEQGVTVPAAGANGAALGAPVIFEDNFDDIDVENANGDDLGEIEDFVLDHTTGQFQYAVLATGGFLGLGERFVPVPVNQIVWGEMDDDPDDLGEMILNVPEDQWENAPSFGSLDEFDTTAEGWATEIETFWANLTNEVTQ